MAVGEFVFGPLLSPSPYLRAFVKLGGSWEARLGSGRQVDDRSLANPMTTRATNPLSLPRAIFTPLAAPPLPSRNGLKRCGG